MKKFIVALLALLSFGAAAQPVQQSGLVTPNHATMWTTNGVVQDAGSALNGKLSELGITKNGGCAFGINSGPTTGPYSQLCFGTSSSGTGYLSLSSFGGAGSPIFNFIIGGTAYQFPYTVGGIVGPVSSQVGDAVCWNNTVGSLAKDCGAPPAFFVADTAALQALPTTILVLTNKVRVGTYLLPVGSTPGIYSPSVDYYLTSTACTADAGSCFNAQGGLYWHITPQTQWDPRWWGAYGDWERDIYTVTVTNGSNSFDIAGVTIPTAYSEAGGRICVTDNISGSQAGPTFCSTISTLASDGSGGTTVTTGATWPNANLAAVAQFVSWSHDDGQALENWDTYVAANVAGEPFANSARPAMDGAGLAYGVCSIPSGRTTASFVFNANAELRSFRAAAICSTNLPIANSAPLEMAGSFNAGTDIAGDANYLPVNACYGASNGNNRYNRVSCKNWLGSGTPVTMTGAATVQAASFTASITGCSGSGPFRCTMTVTAVASGTLQPGQSLDDGQINIPTGTYVQSPISGGVNGTYTVWNATTSPAVSSQTIHALDISVTVTGGSTSYIGYVCRAASGTTPGITDRSMIVGYAGGKIYLNKAPNQAFTGGKISCEPDSNGLLNTGGLHIDNLIVAQDSTSGSVPITLNIQNKYGCAIYATDNGGTSFNFSGFPQAVAGICLAPTSAAYQFSLTSGFNNFTGDPVIELNMPYVVAMDGSNNNLFYEVIPWGQMQFFDITGNSAPAEVIKNPQPAANGGASAYAPNDAVWLYTDNSAPISLKSFNVAPFTNNPELTSTTGSGLFCPTTGVSGSYSDLTALQAGNICNSLNTTLAYGAARNGQFFAGGIDLGTFPLYRYEYPTTLITATGNSLALNENSTGMGYLFNGSGAITVTVSNTLGQNEQAPSMSGFKIPLLLTNTSATVTVTAASGTTLFYGNASVSSVVLQEDVPYQMDCPYNPNGVTAICYLSSLFATTIPVGTPSSSSATCAQGQVEFDASFVYFCVSTNTWRRAATSSF